MESRVSRPPEPIIRKGSMVNTQVTPPKKGEPDHMFQMWPGGSHSNKMQTGTRTRNE